MLLDHLKLPYVDQDAIYNYFEPPHVREIRQSHIKNAIEQHAIAYCIKNKIDATITAAVELKNDYQGTVKLHWRGVNAYDQVYTYGQHIASRRNEWSKDKDYDNSAFLECDVVLDVYGEHVPTLWTTTQKEQYTMLLNKLKASTDWTEWISHIESYTPELKKWANQSNDLIHVKPKWEHIANWNML